MGICYSLKAETEAQLRHLGEQTRETIRNARSGEGESRYTLH